MPPKLTSIPKPETIRVKLWCDRLRQPTWHTYLRTERAEFRCNMRDKSDKSAPSPAWAFVFACDVTGTERRYGMEARS